MIFSHHHFYNAHKGPGSSTLKSAANYIRYTYSAFTAVHHAALLLRQSSAHARSNVFTEWIVSKSLSCAHQWNSWWCWWLHGV